MPFQEVFHNRMALKGLVAGFHTGYFAWEVGGRGEYVHRPQRKNKNKN